MNQDQAALLLLGAVAMLLIVAVGRGWVRRFVRAYAVRVVRVRAKIFKEDNHV